MSENSGEVGSGVDASAGAIETQESSKATREKMMDLFHQRLYKLESSLQENHRVVGERDRPRGVVIMALWEADDSLLATKMAETSLTNLLDQAEKSGIDLDVILVANNGGGATPDLGNSMRTRLSNFAHDEFGSCTEVETARPEGDLGAINPWLLELKIGESSEEEIIGKNRAIIVNQPFDDLNKGKLRGIRDVSAALITEITEHGYAPDFVMEMDAESTLVYATPNLQGKEKAFPPLKAMWNNFHRGEKIGVGTKDRFAVMDTETGEVRLDIPVGSAQKGYEVTNTPNKFITLPGGAMMVRPEYFLAGMSTIAETTPGMGVEDYMFTKMLRKEMRETGKVFEEEAKTMGVVNHVNRTPDNWRAAINQMRQWRKHARAADEIFPEDPYEPEPFVRYTRLVIAARIKDARRKGPVHLKRLIQDIREIPEAIKLLKDKESPNILQEWDINWSPNSVSEK